MATDAEILITREALNAALADIPDLATFTAYYPLTWVTNLIAPDQGWSAGSARIARYGVVVQLLLSGMTRTTAGTSWVPVLTLPEGFKPLNLVYANSDRGTSYRINTGTGLVEASAPPTQASQISFTFGTRQAPPVGSI